MAEKSNEQLVRLLIGAAFHEGTLEHRDSPSYATLQKARNAVETAQAAVLARMPGPGEVVSTAEAVADLKRIGSYVGTGKENGPVVYEGIGYGIDVPEKYAGQPFVSKLYARILHVVAQVDPNHGVTDVDGNPVFKIPEERDYITTNGVMELVVSAVASMPGPGEVVVPVEPTPQMLTAWMLQSDYGDHKTLMRAAYAAMLAARPNQGGNDDQAK